ncbi:hypothetical protein BC567DRAFT_232862 [Phyllosticta citribraziliensis]
MIGMSSPITMARNRRESITTAVGMRTTDIRSIDVRIIEMRTIDLRTINMRAVDERTIDERIDERTIGMRTIDTMRTTMEEEGNAKEALTTETAEAGKTRNMFTGGARGTSYGLQTTNTDIQRRRTAGSQLPRIKLRQLSPHRERIRFQERGLRVTWEPTRRWTMHRAMQARCQPLWAMTCPGVIP